jgi:multicomponent Na+:H+ antiporter subunit G
MSGFAVGMSLLGAAIAVLAGVGLYKFRTPYARIHAAGKASPVAFIVVAIGVGVDLGAVGAARLVLAAVALVLTLPVAVHLLFRALHRAHPEFDPLTDEMRRD